jgi:kumamolisin
LLKRKAARVDWHGPILLALVGAILTLLGNIAVSYANSRNSIAQDKLKAASDLELERLKAKYELILQSIATNDPEAARRNIEFFIGAGLLDDPEGAIRDALARYNPVLPSPSGAPAPDRTAPPAEIAKLYNFPPGLDGSGQVIGLMELGGGFKPAEIAAYFTAKRQPAPDVVEVVMPGAANRPDDISASQQVVADIQLVGGVAPRAQLRVYFATSDAGGWKAAIKRATADGVGILLVNWGAPESEWDRAELEAVNDALGKAARKGVTIIVAAGDQGVSPGAKRRREVVFPASSPWVLAVGGTAMGSSAEGIASEVVWNETGGGASGGGVSRTVERPAWQSSVQVAGERAGAFAGRAIPDVSAAAWRTFTEIGLDGAQTGIGGTTVAAGLWAGLIARLNQGLGRNVGHLNPLLYQAIGPARVLRPITKGDNSRPGVKGYAATDGWSPVAGWGAPDGMKLLAWLKQNG